MARSWIIFLRHVSCRCSRSPRDNHWPYYSLSRLVNLLPSAPSSFAAVAIVSLLYLKRQGQRLASAAIEIEGLSIDALNAANLRRRINRSLIIQSADQQVTIDGDDLDMVWHYTGYCRAERETLIEFSVDSSKSMPFTELDCYAFDLRHDPDQQHKIKPLLIGPDGISKKIGVPFLEPIGRNGPFDIALHCRLPGVFPPQLGYYTSSLSLDQKRDGPIGSWFEICSSENSSWVRVYACNSDGLAAFFSSRIFTRSAKITMGLSTATLRRTSKRSLCGFICFEGVKLDGRR